MSSSRLDRYIYNITCILNGVYVRCSWSSYINGQLLKLSLTLLDDTSDLIFIFGIYKTAELLHYLRQNRLITKDQHGFLTKKSTSTNLMESLNDWTLNIEKRIINLLHILTLQRHLTAFVTINYY